MINKKYLMDKFIIYSCAYTISFVLFCVMTFIFNKVIALTGLNSALSFEIMFFKLFNPLIFTSFLYDDFIRTD